MKLDEILCWRKIWVPTPEFKLRYLTWQTAEELTKYLGAVKPDNVTSSSASKITFNMTDRALPATVSKYFSFNFSHWQNSKRKQFKSRSHCSSITVTILVYQPLNTKEMYVAIFPQKKPSENLTGAASIRTARVIIRNTITPYSRCRLGNGWIVWLDYWDRSKFVGIRLGYEWLHSHPARSQQMSNREQRPCRLGYLTEQTFPAHVPYKISTR
jgi:hypothetical protein